MRETIGIAMIATPFVALFAWFAAKAGLLAAILVFGGSLGAAAFILVGVWLAV